MSGMRILAIAYACEPEKGSEPGAGWAWSRMLARLGETWVITRANNRAAIEEALPSLPPDERPHFIYMDLPQWARFWKRGQRGVHAYYIIWQAHALGIARRLQRDTPFDLVWHLTLTNVWLGSVAALVGPAFVYGPMGGGSRSCWDPRIVGWSGAGYEVARSFAVSLGRYLHPLARISWRRAALILANNDDTVNWLPPRYRKKAEVFPNVALDLPPLSHNVQRQNRVAVFAGRLLPLKGGSLAIRTMEHLPDWHLVVYGTGPDEARLRRLAREIGVEDRVSFRGWIPRRELLESMSVEASVLLFPSVHDQAPWIVGEALTMGLPAVCIDEGGATALGATCVPLGGPLETAKSLADAVRRLPAGPFPRWDIQSRYVELKRLLSMRALDERVER
jgi:glycosyltransferase involved in cell wall biosynthesis